MAINNQNEYPGSFIMEEERAKCVMYDDCGSIVVKMMITLIMTLICRGEGAASVRWWWW